MTRPTTAFVGHRIIPAISIMAGTAERAGMIVPSLRDGPCRTSAPGYPLMPVLAESPWMNSFWAAKNRMIIGIVIMTDAAMSSPQSMS